MTTNQNFLATRLKQRRGLMMALGNRPDLIEVRHAQSCAEALRERLQNAQIIERLRNK